MKIAANLGVCDEVELIAPCIRHLRSIGVDLIVVTNVGSTDGTTEILCDFARDPDICLIEVPPGADPWGFPERMYERTINEFSPDYVLSLDADEFWLPRSGDIKKTIGLSTDDILTARRFNVPPVEGKRLLPEPITPADYDQIHLVVQPVREPRFKFKNDPALAAVMTEVAPKVMLRPDNVTCFTMGGHSAIPREGHTLVERVCDDLMIAHVWFLTYERFVRKMQNVERSLSHFGHRLMDGQAWTWRRWLELYRAGKAEEEFLRQVLTLDQLRSAHEAGIIQSAAKWFEQYAPQHDPTATAR